MLWDNGWVMLSLMPKNRVTNILDLLHNIQENLDLVHKIQVVGKHGYFTSKTGSSPHHRIIQIDILNYMGIGISNRSRAHCGRDTDWSECGMWIKLLRQLCVNSIRLSSHIGGNCHLGIGSLTPWCGRGGGFFWGGWNIFDYKGECWNYFRYHRETFMKRSLYEKQFLGT